MSEANERPGNRFLDVLGSLGLSCVLFFCLFVLTVQGTLYQVDHGLYPAKERFFHSWFLWFERGAFKIPIFPGGITCMLLLTANMLVGGLLRMRIGWRSIGVVIAHLGIAFMLLAGLFKLVTAKEGQLMLFEGDQIDYFEGSGEWEVAVWEATMEGEVVQQVIEDRFLSDLEGDRSRTFTSPHLPFDLVLGGFVPNSRVLAADSSSNGRAGVVDGYVLKSLPVEKDMRSFAGILASASVDGQEQEGILWGQARLPWIVQAGGKRWAVHLRNARHQMPFTLRLDDFQKEDYPGTRKAKAYRSHVTKIEGNEQERILIEMNEPLRHGGLVLYQSSWGPQGGRPTDRLYSVLSVVDNVSDRWPEYSMWVITLGMLLAFGRSLVRYVLGQSAQRSADEGGAQ